MYVWFEQLLVIEYELILGFRWGKQQETTMLHWDQTMKDTLFTTKELQEVVGNGKPKEMWVLA